MTSLQLATPPRIVYRIARRPDPWSFVDWRYARDDSTFGGRFDDPLGEYRVLYMSSERIGAFKETLNRFRPDPDIAEQTLAASEEDGGFTPTRPAGLLPARWLEQRCIGTATISDSAQLADATQQATLNWINERLSEPLDRDTIRVQRRSVTQMISRWIYEAPAPRGAYEGVLYRSSVDERVLNLGIWEPAPSLEPRPETQPLFQGDSDLQAVLTEFGLRVG